MKVEIKKEIEKALQKRVESTDEFKSVEEYVNYVLKQVVEKLEGEQEESTYSEEDEKKVKERLKALGYLD